VATPSGKLLAEIFWIVDADRQMPEGLLQVDVCMVGSGPAGITLAREMSRSQLLVCLLELGGYKPATDTQSLNAGEVDSP
jgi:choline dehydrogenase-like flavoprotein